MLRISHRASFAPLILTAVDCSFSIVFHIREMNRFSICKAGSIFASLPGFFMDREESDVRLGVITGLEVIYYFIESFGMFYF